jgi:hypothetical protein
MVATLFTIFFSTFVAIALLSMAGEIAMRIRLTRAELPSEKLLWWRRGGDDVAEAYGALYPSSRLPLIRVIMFKVLSLCHNAVDSRPVAASLKPLPGTSSSRPTRGLSRAKWFAFSQLSIHQTLQNISSEILPLNQSSAQDPGKSVSCSQ